MWHSLLLTALVLGCAAKPPAPKKPNIVFIFSDDQDRLLGSTDFQSVLRRGILDKGTEFTNHFGTTAQCCPARASILRGQFSHNTNITHVNGPGGNYDKWLASKQDLDYLPVWLKKAGYRTEYVGKFLNGYNTANYASAPKSWDWVDALIDPYTTFYNVPVMSQNGERPVWYKGFHQTDVIRVKALDRLEYLANQDQPFYLTVAPYAPHVQNNAARPIPLKRHMELFPEAKAPRKPNWNPADEFQLKKGSWLRGLPLMNDSVIEFADYTYRSRAQALQGVDEIIEDVVQMLEDKQLQDNTYIVYTSDNGYHIGQNRVPGGKALFYAEDTNLPFAVRGPGIPQGVKSALPSTHVDLAPTFLELAGVPPHEQPVFFDGASLLPQWRDPRGGHGGHGAPQTISGKGTAREALNIEFWGQCTVEAPNVKELGGPFRSNSYKTVRILGSDADGESGSASSSSGNGWLYTKWCTGDAELYHTSADPFELDNLANSTDPVHRRAKSRLNALLMVTKSCEKGSCRDPWAVFDVPRDMPGKGPRLGPGPGPGSGSGGNGGNKISSFEQAMDPRYDAFFDSFPQVAFKGCLAYQSAENEAPFYPPLPGGGAGGGGDAGLGRAYRSPTDNFVETKDALSIRDTNFYGSEEQRRATLAQVYAGSVALTDEQLTTDTRSGGGGGGGEKRLVSFASMGEIDMRREYGFD
ncbi:alkaline-phosphatase-like protein [Microdochium trichocladiopsis]|uniref:Alkaline-phosphatase-like protein n=1 Tax=Microdochium trichocladiopsis TaxID=1682393 RepID=A0A9P8XS62_9PEZI|nr:alkaline-phosphatase-like protein [Microdochium trichocladiopsis]KAH7014423.1 alkaline-phosphatase-like protein [Microdochium trichocladiopsis]